jgi:drug/metabolite transporter (DMT)-like permease
MTGRWRLGLALALTTAVLWGLMPVALKIVLQGMDGYTISWYRFAASALVVGLMLAATRNLPRVSGLGRRAWLLMLVALGGLIGNYLLYAFALLHTTPAVTQVVIQLAPIFLLLGGLALFGERFSRLQWLGLGALLVGLALFFNRRLPLLFDLRGELGLGVSLIVISSMVWAAYGLAQKQLLKELSSQQILWVLYVAAAIVLIPTAHPGTIRAMTPGEITMLVFCAVNTIVAYGAFAEAMQHWEVSRVSSILAIAPLVTLGTMWLTTTLVPGLLEPEHLNGLGILGALLVVAGSAVCALGAPAKQETAANVECRPAID